MELAPISMEIPKEGEKIKEEKSFEIESNNHNKFNIIFAKFEKYIKIYTKKQKDEINKEYEKIYYLDDIKNNKYLSLCDSIDEVYEQIILEMQKNNNKIITEKENEIEIIIPVQHIKIKDIRFSLSEKEKSNDELIQYLFNELKNVKNDCNKLKEETKLLKEDNNYLKKDINMLKDENKLLKEKINFFSESEILNQNDKTKLYKWLKPLAHGKNINLNLLYRRGNDMSYETFHLKCDKKGPTVVICKARKEKFGGFTNINWESLNNQGIYKEGPFIFSIRKNRKYVYSNKNNQSIYLDKNHGPDFCWDLSFNTINGMRTCVCGTKECGYAYSSEPLLGDGSTKDIEIDEVEVFQFNIY